MRWSRAGAVGLAAVSLAVPAVLAGCGNGAPPAAAEPPASTAPSDQVAPVWPDPALVTVTTPRGVREPAAPITDENRFELEWYVEEQGLTLEEAGVESQDQMTWMSWSGRARALLGDRYSADAWRDPEDRTRLPWFGFTGTEVPVGLAELAEELPFPIELRGGAVLSEAERERVMGPGTDAFRDDVGSMNWSGHLFAPTGRYTIDYVPDGAEKRADDATAEAMVAATLKALGRDAPITVEFVPDDTDPTTTTPAVWFLPKDFAADPTATSVEVLVYEQGCTSGAGAEGNTAEPQVEVTPTQVRIAVSTYIRKGSQACPNHPVAPLVVELGQPLGDRELVDVNGHLDDDLAPSVTLVGDVQVPAAG